MIFILDILLIINVYIAYKYFKSIVSPPFLLGCGMLLASLMATSYYEEWIMNEMCLKSVGLIGGGCCFFTISCILFSKIFKIYKLSHPAIFNHKFNTKRIRLFYIFSILIGLLGILLKLYYMKSQFGSLGLSELIVARRMDQWNGENNLKIPSIVRQMGSYTSVISFLSTWLYSIIIISKDKYLKKIKWLIILHLCITFFDGMLSGSKAPLLELIVIFGVMYFYNYYAKIGKYYINKKMFIRFAIIMILLAVSFRGLSLLIGRNVDERTNIDLLAEYCGAQIKNFDIYIQENPQKVKTNVWGENTFFNFYSELYPEKFEKEPDAFQFINNHSLGNVYTLFKPYHQDFGNLGVFTISFFIAFVSMFFYAKSTYSLKKPAKINAYLIIYSTMAMSIFMGFFSSRFTESICRPGWFRTVIYILILVWIVNHFLIKYTHKRWE